jgi:hypothetical protein
MRRKRLNSIPRICQGEVHLFVWESVDDEPPPDRLPDGHVCACGLAMVNGEEIAYIQTVPTAFIEAFAGECE